MSLRAVAVVFAAASIAAGAFATTASAVVDAPVDFVEIPAGPFMMGADRSTDPAAFENERWSATEAQGTVDLPTFYIARHEVTVASFAEFARATQWKIDTRAVAAPPGHPVTLVSWPDALVYCRWLQKNLQGVHKTLASNGWQVTLPTEAQWEKAARGTDGRRYPWGNEPRTGVANFVGGAPQLADGTTSVVPALAPVGFFKCPGCAYGLADMSGNVWEWTSSPYQPYPYTTSDDRTNLDADALWVIRGGHFGDDARMVRTTARTGADPGARRPFIGFRVALTKR
jgi:formylglycine-generating enzyme required for sulfatase activity